MSLTIFDGFRDFGARVTVSDDGTSDSCGAKRCDGEDFEMTHEGTPLLTYFYVSHDTRKAETIQ
jgi:hypothetical protein